MRLRDRTTGQIYSLLEIQQKFPNVSFPQIWDSSTCNFANVDIIVTVPKPDVSIYNRADYVGIDLVDGVWKDIWNVVPRYDDPTEQAQWVADCALAKWEEIRAERNVLLTQTDYTQMPDTPITPTNRTEFATYRQALRDITSQDDPYSVIWPISPTYQKE